MNQTAGSKASTLPSHGGVCSNDDTDRREGWDVHEAAAPGSLLASGTAARSPSVKSDWGLEKSAGHCKPSRARFNEHIILRLECITEYQMKVGKLVPVACCLL